MTIGQNGEIRPREAGKGRNPPDREEQHRLIIGIQNARVAQRDAASLLHEERLKFSDVIDGRGAEELPDVNSDQRKMKTAK